MSVPNDLYYDPYDFEIDTDPYPIWRRMRAEAPLYYNEKYDFFALCRFDDVEKALIDWNTYRSGRGSVLELIKANVEMPPGIILFEDPPIHDVHRSILSRVFTPKRMLAIEPQVRKYCAQTLDPFLGEEGFDFIRDLGAFLPMRVIGMLLGIPEGDQEAIRDRLSEGLQLDESGVPKIQTHDSLAIANEMFSDYIDWRAENPSDDLMTELLNAEFEDDAGTVRKLTREEVLTYLNLLAGAGNETTTRLIGWTGKVLADHPDQLKRVAEDRRLVSKVIEEVLRYEAPFCLGAALARLEGRVALDEVLKRWTHWDVDREGAVLGHTSTTRGWERLPVSIKGT